MTKKRSFKLTTTCSFIGIFVQATITNLTAILFIPMMDLYGFSYGHLGTLVAINFTAQVAADIIFSGMIDKVGYRKLILPTNLIAFSGLVLFAMSPLIFKNNVFVGIVISTIIFAMASGLLEVLISPMINAIPSDDKDGAMSLLHSFYAWGQVATIIITTLFIFIFGGENWQWVVLFWAIIPLINFFLFRVAPFPEVIAEEHRQDMKDLLFKPFYLLALVAIFVGAASEVTINQWSSTFMEKSLELPKVVGDLLGMCGFAVMLGLGRLLYGIYSAKFNLNNVLIVLSAVAVVCYLGVALSPNIALNVFLCALCGFCTCLMWPGTLMVSSNKYPMAGAWMFAILAAAGDLGASFGPWLTGAAVDAFSNTSIATTMSEAYNITTTQSSMRIGILIAVIFPIITFFVHIAIKRRMKDKA